MRIAVAFDTPHIGWSPADHDAQMAKEVASWKKTEPEMEYQVAHTLRASGHDVLLVGVHDDLRELRTLLADWKPAVVINAAESFLGNSNLDYLIAAVLEAENYCYTGAPPLSLLVTRNKAMSKKILAFHGINVPNFVSYRQGERPESVSLRFPLIVKPLQCDASEGIAQASIVRDLGGLVNRVTFVHEQFEQAAIAEEYIEGREIYATVIGNGDSLEILPPTELVFDHGERPEHRIATQAAKWDQNYRKRHGIRSLFARRMSASAKARLEENCRTAYRALWLRDYARLDVRLAPDGEVWFIEANANPYLGYGSDSAEAAHKAGLKYGPFLERIVEEAIRRR